MSNMPLSMSIRSMRRMSNMRQCDLFSEALTYFRPDSILFHSQNHAFPLPIMRHMWLSREKYYQLGNNMGACTD